MGAAARARAFGWAMTSDLWLVIGDQTERSLAGTETSPQHLFTSHQPPITNHQALTKQH